LRDDIKAQALGVAMKSFDLAVTDEVVVGFSVASFERSLVAEHIEDDDGDPSTGSGHGL
jgi:hypothetical protein